MLPLLRSLRPHQWTKNLVVFAGVFFSGKGMSGSALADEGLTFLLFCALSSAVYLFNDVLDVERDRLHPVKRNRPIASGQVGTGTAIALSAALAAAALAGAWLVGQMVFLVLAAYLVLQAAYTLRLKRVVILDVLCIAGGFFLRVSAGVAAIDARISPWLIACSVQLALFLALCKRRAEADALVEGAGETGQRPTLQDYAGPATDMMIGVMAAATLVTYTLYTILPSALLWQFSGPKVESQAGNPWMMTTLPFVLYGMLRYLFLVYQRNRGERPEWVLLTDKPLLAAIFLYAVAAGWAVYGAPATGG